MASIFLFVKIGGFLNFKMKTHLLNTTMLVFFLTTNSKLFSTLQNKVLVKSF